LVIITVKQPIARPLWWKKNKSATVTAPNAMADGKKPLKTRAISNFPKLFVKAQPKAEQNPRRVVKRYTGLRPHLLASGIHRKGPTPFKAITTVLKIE